MKVIMIFDQIQSGAGTKDDKMVALAGKKEPLGPAVMMQPMLKEINAHIIACLYCGTGTYQANKAEVSRKLCAMVKKLNPDIVICGPAFNYLDYGSMAAEIAYDIVSKTDIPAFAAMSKENEETINAFKNKIAIVETPKKGGFGLNEALRNMCSLAKAKVNKEDTTALENKICFK